VDKRSASTISLAANALPAAATQIWNCCPSDPGVAFAAANCHLGLRFFLGE